MKSLYFDTSVLVAAAAPAHFHHELALPWFRALHSKRFTACLSCHVIAEFYATMTSLKFDFAVDPLLFASTIEKHVRSNFKIINVPDRVYFKAVSRTAQFTGRGGRIYDVLHFEAALAAKCDGLVTFNIKDFTRLAQNEKTRILDAAEGP